MRIFDTHVDAFGLDISAGSIKVAQIRKAGRKVKLQCLTRNPLPKGIVSGDTILDIDALSKMIVRTLDKPEFGHVTTSYVNLALPESKSFVRVIHIPKMGESEADNAVKFEAEAYIPLPIDQVYIDWQPTGLIEDNRMEILMIASPKEQVDKYIQALEKAHLRPKALEVESQSITRCLIPPSSSEAILIIDIGNTRTSLVMVSSGNLQFTSSVPVAGAALTEAISTYLGVTNPQAEAIKIRVGMANSTDYPNLKLAMQPVMANLVAEIKNVLNFQKQHSSMPVTQLWICGGSAKLAHVTEYFTEQFKDYTGMKVMLADPAKILSGIVGLDPGQQKELLSFTSALGLALREVIS